MLFRAVIFGVDHSINVVWIKPNTGGNWFTFRGRAYRKERETVRQVVGREGKLTNVVEALYYEGNPLAIGSFRTPEGVTLEHLDEIMSRCSNRVTLHKGLFAFLFRGN